MIEFKINIPYECEIKRNVRALEDCDQLTLELLFEANKVYEKDAFFIGFESSKTTPAHTFLMTHESSIERYVIPFAFPAFMGRFGEEISTGAWMVLDYYELPIGLRIYQKKTSDMLISYGLTNDTFKVQQDTTVRLHVKYKVYTKDAPKLIEMIKVCAHHVLLQQDIKPSTNLSYTTNVHNYADAAYGLSNNLKDDRARILDGTGTFIPYGYLEQKPYSESFALMDVAKGMLPYALWHDRKDLLKIMYEELHKMTDENRDFPWIDYDHHTDGFFHLAWGSLPVGVTKEYILNQSIGLFSDVDGHEEGPNLLSTWKYFYRVEILGEMALLTHDEQIIDGFKKTLPFVNRLKMEEYAQPVTYDLDLHIPVTGKDHGGSAGGAAFWSMIHLTAFDLTKDSFYLREGLLALKHANKLDFNQYYSMRVAPKPTTVGWLTKANVYAYELTHMEHFLEDAKNVAQSIYFFYYISAHPYTYFPTLGFGYACSRERWEAFLEMVESLYCLSFLLKYSSQKDLLKLFWYARENWLWAIPLNGNPYGNLTRPYDSIGAEYIPYEFSTGSLGDNPGIEGGSQSSMRQIKEIYGSGEVFLAYTMFEMNAYINDRKFLVVKSDLVNHVVSDILHFVVYNTDHKPGVCIIAFQALKENAYEIVYDQKTLGVYSKETLYQGIPLSLEGDESVQLVLKPLTDEIAGRVIETKNLNLNITGFEHVDLTWDSIHHRDFSHYRVMIKNKFYHRTYDVVEPKIVLDIDRELDHQIDIIAYTKDIKFQSLGYLLPKLNRHIHYRLTHEQSSEISFSNADMIDDGHMWMFYGQPNQKQLSIKMPVGYTLHEDDLIQFQIASLNTACVYDLHIHHMNNDITTHISGVNPQMIEISSKELKNPAVDYIELVVSGQRGLGVSFKRLDIVKFTLNPVKDNLFIMPQVYQNQGLFEMMMQLEDTTSFQYLDIYMEGLSRDAQLRVYLDHEEVEMAIEKAYPNKKHRGMNGIYRFIIKNHAYSILKVQSSSKHMRLKAIRLTNHIDYPKYAEFKVRKEDKDEQFQ